MAGRERRSVPDRGRPAVICSGRRGWDRWPEFVSVLVRRDVIEEDEGVCARAGMHAGLVDIASFNVVNAVLAAAQEKDGRIGCSCMSRLRTRRWRSCDRET